ncbi:NUDIX hydrolase [Floricoccus penangensis]|uniref:NUDIX hydrolase n=1 Tax=Floricoccus penangensis TaxID=1859475 RepID=UPI002040FDB0|nr:NUDIX domain-containing protein [Floricoccus penangensis]URZ88048.1 NUDIX domain-containing protein [Floricoccus penangensis]
MPEYIKSFDDAMNFLQVLDRDIVHERGLWHETVHFYLIVDGQYLLIQKRADHKKNFPACYDLSAAGHIAHDEDIEIAFQREVYEELGLYTKDLNISKIGIIHDEILTKEINDREFAHTYIGKINSDILSSINLQDEEVAGAFLIKINELKNIFSGISDGKIYDLNFNDTNLFLNKLNYLPHDPSYLNQVIEILDKEKGNL